MSHNIEIPTSKEYENAISRLSESQKNMLTALSSFPNSSATAKELANVLNYSGYQEVNLKLGRIGRYISEYTGIIPPLYGDHGKLRPAYYLLIGGYDKKNGWKMWEELQEALMNLNLVSKDRDFSNQSLGVEDWFNENSHNAYLFVWNPKKWPWSNLEENIEELQTTGKVTLKWNCKGFKNIRPGDRVFLTKVGTTPKGIIGSGRVVSEPFLSPHWSGEDKEVPRVLIEFDVLLNPGKDNILTLDLLNVGNLKKQLWTPQSSGISIKPDVIHELEEEWFEFLRANNIGLNAVSDVAESTRNFVEGSVSQILQTRYERNPYARNLCLMHYGYTCEVCKFNFEKFYGNIGYRFIHVHHLTQISTIGKKYNINPVEDLRPVCPNCHAMLHKRNPPLSIEELRVIIGEVAKLDNIEL